MGKVGGGGGRPVMGPQNAINVARTRKDDTVRVLTDVNAIEIRDQTKVAEGGLGFAG